VQLKVTFLIINYLMEMQIFLLDSEIFNHVSDAIDLYLIILDVVLFLLPKISPFFFLKH
jgi:hypothetical protein